MEHFTRAATPATVRGGDDGQALSDTRGTTQGVVAWQDTTCRRSHLAKDPSARQRPSVRQRGCPGHARPGKVAGLQQCLGEAAAIAAVARPGPLRECRAVTPFAPMMSSNVMPTIGANRGCFMRW